MMIFLEKKSESSDDNICGDFEDDEGCQYPFMIQNTRTIQPDACERQNILEHEDEIVSTCRIHICYLPDGRFVLEKYFVKVSNNVFIFFCMMHS